MNLLWIVMDAVRADHLSCYGYTHPTTPTIDGLAGQGVRFEEVITPGARTWESFCSFLTGLYPPHHGVRFMGSPGLSTQVPLLTEILCRQGFETLGRTADLSLVGLDRGFSDFDPAWRKQRSGIHRFRTINHLLSRFKPSVFDPTETARGDARETDEALRWIRHQKDKPWFSLIRYLTAHWPYWPPAPFDSMFAPDSNLDHRFNDNHRREEIVAGRGLTPDQVKHAISHYDGAIRFIDGEIARLVEGLNTATTFTST